MHLTNYSLNKENPAFRLPDDSTDILEINEAHKRTYSSVKKSMEKAGFDTSKIQ